MKYFILFFFFLFPLFGSLQAQTIRDVPQSQQFRLGEGIIRIAEPGQLTDTVNVWGDINTPGRYMIAQGTTLPELISYARGPARYITGETTLDWSKVRLEITVSRYDRDLGMDEVKNFVYRYNEPVPKDMRHLKLDNGDVISIQVRRRPAFADYVRVVAPVVSTIATSFLILERLRGN